MKPQKWQIVEREDGPLKSSEEPFYWLEIVDSNEESEELKTINSCEIKWEPDQRPSRDLRLMAAAPQLFDMLKNGWVSKQYKDRMINYIDHGSSYNPPVE